MTRIAPSLRLWLVIAISQPTISAQAQELAQGKVRLVGRYNSDKLKEGPAKKTYYEITKDKEIRFRIGGPTNLILLLRSAKATKVDLEIGLDGKKSHKTSVQAYAEAALSAELQAAA